MRIYQSSCFGYAMLNVLLGVMLLTGVVYLIMHTMTKYHAQENARAIGVELAPIIGELLLTDTTNFAKETSYALVSTTTTTCANTTPILTTISTKYLQSLKTSGFDLASSACVVILG